MHLILFFKRLYVILVMKVIANAFCSASRFEHIIKNEIASFPEGFTIMMIVRPSGARLVLIKKNGKLRKIMLPEKLCDLVVSFKNYEAAFLMFSAQISTSQGYCEKRIYVSGDIPCAMALIRSLAVIERYLFPAVIAKRVMKRFPPINFFRLTAGRLRLFTFGIPFGL